MRDCAKSKEGLTLIRTLCSFNLSPICGCKASFWWGLELSYVTNSLKHKVPSVTLQYFILLFLCEMCGVAVRSTDFSKVSNANFSSLLLHSWFNLIEDRGATVIVGLNGLKPLQVLRGESILLCTETHHLV